MKWKLANGNVVLKDTIIERGDIIIEGENIGEVGAENISLPCEKIVDVRGHYVLPGFIDLHCHGGNGSDIMDCSSEAVETISRFHASGGTAYFLATTASDSLENISNVLEIIRGYKKEKANGGAKVLGVHLEGPYFAQRKHGCHLQEFIRNPSAEESRKLLEYSDVIKSITIAPEIPGATELIKELAEKNIVVSLGHTECNYKEAMKANSLGAKHVTHLFCAMSGIVKNGIERSGGLIETALLEESLTAEIIADGYHVPAELIRLAVKVKGIDNISIVTDAMRGAGMNDGVYTFGSLRGQEAIVKDC